MTAREAFESCLESDLEMKREGWFMYTPWEWERTKEIAVFTIDDKGISVKFAVIKEIRELLKEFSILLEVTDGNFKHIEDLQQILALLNGSIKNAKIDYEKFEKDLRIIRDKGRLPYGMVIVIDKDRYEFYNPLKQRDRAIYGIGVCDGLVILRHTHKESVRHELAHMLGLTHHEPPKSGCIMNWECATPTFCDGCKRKIQGIWQDECNDRS